MKVERRRGGRGNKHSMIRNTRRNARGGETNKEIKDDLLVVGPGVLGTRIARVWKNICNDDDEMRRENRVTAKARSEETVQKLRTNERDVFDSVVATWEEDTNEKGESRLYRHVVFAAPPSGNANYSAEVAAAAQRVDWSDDAASFVFTGSAGIYAVQEGECCEDAEVNPASSSERTARLVASEEACIAAGGCVLRLAGLYHATRGAHSYYLSLMRAGKTADASAHALLNLIHYDDAATLVVTALRKGARGAVYLGADGAPISRDAMMRATLEASCSREEADALGASLENGNFFVGRIDAPEGKRLNAQWTRTKLEWEPAHASFDVSIAQTREKNVMS